MTLELNNQYDNTVPKDKRITNDFDKRVFNYIFTNYFS